MKMLQAKPAQPCDTPLGTPPEQPTVSCNLLLIAQPQHVQLADFEQLALPDTCHRARGPCLCHLGSAAWHVDTREKEAFELPHHERFAPEPIRYFKPWRGHHFSVPQAAQKPE